jgi:hypothetical protein
MHISHRFPQNRRSGLHHPEAAACMSLCMPAFLLPGSAAIDRACPPPPHRTRFDPAPIRAGPPGHPLAYHPESILAHHRRRCTCFGRLLHERCEMPSGDFVERRECRAAVHPPIHPSTYNRPTTLLSLMNDGCSHSHACRKLMASMTPPRPNKC